MSWVGRNGPTVLWAVLLCCWTGLLCASAWQHEIGFEVICSAGIGTAGVALWVQGWIRGTRKVYDFAQELMERTTGKGGSDTWR